MKVVWGSRLGRDQRGPGYWDARQSSAFRTAAESAATDAWRGSGRKKFASADRLRHAAVETASPFWRWKRDDFQKQRALFFRSRSCTRRNERSVRRQGNRRSVWPRVGGGKQLWSRSRAASLLTGGSSFLRRENRPRSTKIPPHRNGVNSEIGCGRRCFQRAPLTPPDTTSGARRVRYRRRFSPASNQPPADHPHPAPAAGYPGPNGNAGDSTSPRRGEGCG